MNIYGSLMDIFDQKKQENFMNIFGSLMDIFDEKKQRHSCRNIASRLCPLHTYIVRSLVLLHTKTRYESLGITPSFSYLVTLYNPLPR